MWIPPPPLHQSFNTKYSNIKKKWQYLYINKIYYLHGVIKNSSAKVVNNKQNMPTDYLLLFISYKILYFD
jgi:uncharacterized protein YutD